MQEALYSVRSNGMARGDGKRTISDMAFLDRLKLYVAVQHFAEMDSDRRHSSHGISIGSRFAQRA
jgi:hypothetical protein